MSVVGVVECPAEFCPDSAEALNSSERNRNLVAQRDNLPFDVNNTQSSTYPASEADQCNQNPTVH